MKITMITQFVPESLHNIIWDVQNFGSMIFDRYLDNSAPSTAASSSNRGIVCGFMGATLLVDITNADSVLLLGLVPLRQDTVPYASFEKKLNTDLLEILPVLLRWFP